MFHVKHSDLYLCFPSGAKHFNQPHRKAVCRNHNGTTRNIPKKISFSLLKCGFFVIYYHYILLY